MANPTKYQRGYSFSGFQATNPKQPLPASRVDDELEAVEQSIDDLVDGLTEIRRADGALQNGIVTADSLHPALTFGFSVRGAWEAGVLYRVGDGLVLGNRFYRAATTHTSTAENRPDVDPETWTFLFEAGVAIVGDGTVTEAKLGLGAVTVGKLADNAVTRSKLADNAVGTAEIEDAAVTQAKIGLFRLPGLAAPYVSRVLGEMLADSIELKHFYYADDMQDAAAVARWATDPTYSRRKLRIPYRAAGYDFGALGVTLGTGQFIEIDAGTEIRGNGPHMFRMVGADESGIKGGMLNMLGSPAGSSAIRFGTASGIVNNVHLEKLRFRNCVSAIDDEVHATNYSVDIYLHDCRSVLTRGRQLYSRRSRGFWHIDFRVDHTYNTAPVTWEGVRFEDLIGIEIIKLDVLGPTPATVTPGYQAGATGVVIDGNGAGTASVYVTGRILIDNTMGPGLVAQDINFLHGNLIEAFDNLGPAIKFVNCTNFQIQNLYASGALGITGAANSAHNVEIRNCSRIDVDSLFTDTSTGTGLYLPDSTDCRFGMVRSYGNAAFGLYEEGTSNRNIYSGEFKGTQGSMNLVGAQSVAKDFYPNSNLYVATLGGPQSLP